MGGDVAEVRISAITPVVATDADEMDRTVLAAMCLHGVGCREGLNCPRGPTDVHRQLFAEKKQLR